MPAYTADYYTGLMSGGRLSAQAIVPIVMDLVRPRSVIDVGCGSGTWLAVFREAGVEDVLGVDGEWVDGRVLEIPAERFLAHDLRQPLRLARSFDLVVSLETAEHLPPECADGLVDTLTRLGPAVLFSAAIPYEGGYDHLNEQWPEYWAQRFEARGYAVLDAVRRHVWHREDVEWWYAQNTLLYVHRDVLAGNPRLQQELERTAPNQLAIVHPRQYLIESALTQYLVLLARDLDTVVPYGATIVLVDQERIVRGTATAGRHLLPFFDEQGTTFGPPGHDENLAIEEVERLRAAGARYVVFGWTAFWWLDCYPWFDSYLRWRYPVLIENDRLIVFELTPKAKAN